MDVCIDVYVKDGCIFYFLFQNRSLPSLGRNWVDHKHTHTHTHTHTVQLHLSTS